MGLNLKFAAAFLLLLAVEIYIAIFVRGGFIRHYAGDVLATIALYTLVRAVVKRRINLLPLKVFIFALFLEIAQYFGISEILGIKNKILLTIIGGTFDVSDIACYGVGCITAAIFERYAKATNAV